MLRIIIATAFVLVIGMNAPAVGQKAEIVMNAKWIDFFNKGDFAGVASLYTEDAVAFPPGAPDDEGSGCDRANVESHGGTSARSEDHDA
jgi:ketosteroid isomerase-like protein